MKQRFSSLDVIVVAQELSLRLNGERLTNIYDVPPHSILFKFGSSQSRHSLLLNPGYHCFLTEYSRETASAPSVFVTRLRKILNNKRVSQVSQLGSDRIIDFYFGDGQCHLFLEFFSLGNVVVTDSESRILAILRPIPEGQGQPKQFPGEIYHVQSRNTVAEQRPPPLEELKERLKASHASAPQETEQGNGRSQKASRPTLLKALGGYFNDVPVPLVHHELCLLKFDAHMPLEEVLANDDFAETLQTALRSAQAFVEGLSSITSCKGHIISKKKTYPAPSKTAENEEGKAIFIADDFQPFRPAQLTGLPDIKLTEYDTYNQAIDHFFSATESTRLEARLRDKETIAEKRLDNARLAHAQKITQLQNTQDLHIRKAQLIEENLKLVEEASSAVNTLLAQGMDWQTAEKLIEGEKRRANTVARAISLPLNLKQNRITLQLSSATTSDGDSAFHLAQESEAPAEVLNIDIDLALSAWSNARQYYDQKKSVAQKQQKTAQASKKALQNSEKKIKNDLKKSLASEKEQMRPRRQPLWFEKFYYFVSSEGYLMMSGKDAQQSEMLYRQHFAKDDVFVHADVSAASSVVVKQKVGISSSEIPPSTLAQAGVLALASSTAWVSKAVMPAWYVSAGQVSKIDPHGQVMSAGEFAISGEKSFLPPSRLALGFGLLFRVNDESKRRHLKHRLSNGDAEDAKPRTESEAQAERPTHDELTSYAEGPSIAMSGLALNEDKDAHIRDDAVEMSKSEVIHRDHSSTQPSPEQYPGLETAKIIDSDAPGNLQQSPQSDKGSANEVQRIENTEMDTRGHGGPDDAQVSVNVIGDDARPSAKQDGSERASIGTHTPPKEKTKPNPSVPVRNRRKKQQERRKHGHQDDEERAVALRLVGAASFQEKKIQSQAQSSAKDQMLEAQRERRARHQAAYAAKVRKTEEKRHTSQDSKAMADDRDHEQATIDFDAFIGKPGPDDEILDILPICGAWDAIGNRCRWREKIQLGTMKKGQAVKQILQNWNKNIMDAEKRSKSEESKTEGQEDPGEPSQGKEHQSILALRDADLIAMIPVSKIGIATNSTDDRKNKHASKRRGGKASSKR